MSSWIKGTLSAALILFSVFLFFHAYNVWVLSHRLNPTLFLNSESEKLPVYVGLGLVGLASGLFLLRGKGLEFSQLRRKVLSVVLIFLGSLFLFEAYNTWMVYNDVFYMTKDAIHVLSFTQELHAPVSTPNVALVSWFLKDWQQSISRPCQILPFFVIVGAILLLIGILKATRPKRLKIRNLIRATPFGVPMALSGFLYFYAYYMWIGHYIGQDMWYPFYVVDMEGHRLLPLIEIEGHRFLPLVAASPWFVGPLDQWLPYYIVTGFVSLAIGLIATYRASNTQMLKSANIILSGSITVFGEFMIFYGYNFMAYYVKGYHMYVGTGPYPEVARLPLYFIAGFVSFATALIITYRAVKTKPSELTKAALSTILLATGSILIYDAYTISVTYNVWAWGHSPDHMHTFFAGLQQAYQWLPLYIAVALTSIASGLIIAYKTHKTLRELARTEFQNDGLLLLSPLSVLSRYPVTNHCRNDVYEQEK